MSALQCRELAQPGQLLFQNRASVAEPGIISLPLLFAYSGLFLMDTLLFIDVV